MKIIHIVGNRPQFIKLALLLRALQARNTENIILHTGQHFDVNMSTIFFEDLQIPFPSYTLDINNLSHNEMIGEMLIGIDPILNKERPAYVIVYGDTNTTLAGALAAKKRDIPVAHVEAGIRTMDEQMPEESNRYITDRISTLNFCCTYVGMENLEMEGFLSGRIHSGVHNSGDLMLDASIAYKDIALQKEKRIPNLNPAHPFVLATIHRAENTGNEINLKNIIRAINNIHRRTKVVFLMHPNTKMKISQLGLKTEFIVCDALGYLDALALVQKCQSVITDSGGLSREAFFFHKPTLVLMRNSFWPEIIIHGNCMSANAISDEIEAAHQRLLSTDKPFKTAIFGDGNAAEKISSVLFSTF